MARDELEKRIARLRKPHAIDGRSAKSAYSARIGRQPNVKLVLRDSLDGFTPKVKAIRSPKGPRPKPLWLTFYASAKASRQPRGRDALDAGAVRRLKARHL